MTELIAEVSEPTNANLIPIRSFPVAQFLATGLIFLVISSSILYYVLSANEDNNSPEEVFRCQDEFRMDSELKNVIKGKEVHVR